MRRSSIKCPGKSAGDKIEREFVWADHCCATCGAHGEYGVEWPCPTVQAIAAALGVEP